MATDIKCPNCGHEFDIENVLSGELELKYQKEFQEKLSNSLQAIEVEKQKLLDEQKNFEEKKKKENELFSQRLSKEKQKLSQELQESITKSVATDFENQLKMLQQNASDTE